MVYYRSKEERDQAAKEAIESYLDDGWDDEVEYVAAGELTHFAQVLNKQMRPSDSELDDETRDEDGIEWEDGVEWRGNYTLEPVAPPQDGWLPIATAPKSSRVLVCGGERNAKDGYADVQGAWVSSTGNVWADDRIDGSRPIQPTHWMPLPDQPK